MKKFLTVLLALSVVFTYSFSAVGSVFAADGAAVSVTNEEANLIKSARDYVKNTVIPDSVAKACKNVAEDAYITDAAWNAISADVVEALTDAVDAQADAYLTGTAELPDDWNKYASDLNYTGAQLFSGNDYTAVVDKLNADWKDDAAKAQFAINYDDIVGVYDKIDVAALYSKTSPSETDSYYAKAVKAISNAKDTLKEYFFNDKGEVINVGDTYDSIVNSEAALKQWVTEGKPEIQVGEIKTPTTIGVIGEVWEGTTVVKYYRLNTSDIKTMEQEESAGKIDNANKAAMKAQAMAVYAEYVATAGADKDFAEDWLEAVLYLIDNDVAIIANINGLTGATTELKQNYAAAAEYVADLNAFAAKYKAEKDAAGNPVRDAEAVDKLVKEYTKAAYNAAATGSAPATNQATKNKIAAMSSKTDAAQLIFDKEVEKAKLAEELDAALADYYDLEAAKVTDAYEAAYAKVDAATKNAEFTAIEADLNKEVSKISKKPKVEGLFAGTSAMAKEFQKQVDALKAYLTYKNSPLAGKPYEDGYVVYKENELSDMLRDYYIEKDVRTVEDLKALTNAVEEVAAKLPTNAELAVAKKAAEDAVKALPAASKITSADKDAVVNAFELVQAYEEMAELAGTTPAEISIPQAATLRNAIQSDFQLAYAKADKNDKAALNAIADDMAAANNELVGDGKLLADSQKFTTPAGLDSALEKIKKAEFAAVKAAINALPVNIELGDKEAVEAARKLYDEYVKEYTTYSNPAHNAATEFVNNEARVLALAEAAISVLENEAAIKAVEALKLTASSTAKKGSITVKWKVKGDSSVADGFQVYRSKKMNSGYGTKAFFTTDKNTKRTYKNTKSLKKGTRYYYKVRAYKVVDGKTYYSDWSNKAYRIAK